MSETTAHNPEPVNGDEQNVGEVAVTSEVEKKQEDEQPAVAEEEEVKDEGALQFELIILVPKRTFSLPPSSTPPPKLPLDLSLLSSYHELVIPVSPTDTARELRQTVLDSLEGFWCGSFGFAKVGVRVNRKGKKEGEQVDDDVVGGGGEESMEGVGDDEIELVEEDWKGQKIEIRDGKVDVSSKGEPSKENVILEGTKGKVLGDYTELGGVFGTENEKEGEGRRILKVVDVPYTETEARLHLLRVRDLVITGSSSILSANPSSGFPGYDPTSFAIDAGKSLFRGVRGKVVDGAFLPASGFYSDIRSVSAESLCLFAPKPLDHSHGEHTHAEHEHHEEASKAEGADSGKGKGKGKGKKGNTNGNTPSGANGADATTTEAAPAKVEEQHAFATFDPTKIGPFDSLSKPSTPTPSSSSPIPTPCLKNLALSVWNPPPHHLRLRGHLVYITLTTLEGDLYHVTGSRNGWYINKSTNTLFDPSPKSPKAEKFPHLFALLQTISPLFISGLTNLLTASSCSPSQAHLLIPDIFATVPITNCVPAFPWLTSTPTPVPDPIRNQSAYLVTGSTSAETLLPARDWNEEFTAIRELPRKTINERLFRERMISRLNSEFTNAATRGVVGIVHGEIPPLNPSEPPSAHTYIHNNILFTRGEDATNVYGKLGGDSNEAAHVAVNKDFRGVALLNAADIKGIHTTGATLVDYSGERWLAQSVLPGIFKLAEEEEEKEKEAGEKAEGEESAEKATSTKKGESEEYTLPPPSSFRIAYGSADVEHPLSCIRSDASFHELLAQVADKFSLELHKVKDEQGRESELWTSLDTHGVFGSDGKRYLIDLFRLQPVDVTFLEGDIKGPLFPFDSASSSANSEAADSEPVVGSAVATGTDYPHRMALLRRELIVAYRDTEMRKWVTEELKKIGDKPQTTDEKGEGAGDSSSGKDVAAVEKSGDAKTEDEGEKKESAAQNKHVINTNNFKVLFNPDAFVNRSGESGEVSTESDAEDASSKSVREASNYLRKNVIPTWIVEMLVSGMVPADGAYLTKQAHRRGINMRYLGLAAHLTGKGYSELELPKAERMDLRYTLDALRRMFLREMVFRASKRVLRRTLRQTPRHEHSYCISHFLNCLLGFGLDPNPTPDTIEVADPETSLWTSFTPSSLHREVAAEVVRRFRYNLPVSYFETDLAKPQLLRELCTRTGLQLELRKYHFDRPVAVNEDSHVNGNGIHSTDDEKSAESGDGLDKEKAKKKKKGGKKVVKEEKRPDLTTTFEPADILNVVPMVKDTQHKSILADQTFEEGRANYLHGNYEAGEVLTTQALTFYEQIFGNVHPELAARYHGLGLIYYQVAQSILRKLDQHESLLAQAKLRRPGDPPIENLPAPEETEQLRQDVYNYLETAVRMVRQSVIISERVHGLDSAESIQQYTDLATLELAVENAPLGLKYIRHALELSATVYGPGYPEAARLVASAAGMVQAVSGYAEAVKVFIQSRDVATEATGPMSLSTAFHTSQLAHIHALNADLKASIPYAKEALRIYEERLGKDDEKTKDVESFLAIITQSAVEQAKGEEERAKRLAKRLRMDEGRTRQLLASRSAALEADPEASGIVGVGGMKDGTGSRGHLDVDELVSYIQGMSTGAAQPTPVKSAKTKAHPSKKRAVRH